MVMRMVEDAVAAERPPNMRKRSLIVRYVAGGGEHAREHVGEDWGDDCGEGDGEHADEHADEEEDEDEDEDADEDFLCIRF